MLYCLTALDYYNYINKKRGRQMLNDLITKLRQYEVTTIAYESGVSASQISNILAGRATNPTIKTYEALQKFIEDKEAKE